MLKDLSQMYCFIQITSSSESSYWSEGGMASVYEPIADSKFKIVKIQSREDIWKEFKKIFSRKY